VIAAREKLNGKCNTKGKTGYGTGATPNNNVNLNVQLSAENIFQLMDNRKSKYDGVTQEEVALFAEDAGNERFALHDATQRAALEAELRQQQQADDEFKRTVANTKVPLHGDIRLEKKDPEVLRAFSHNINGMSFWLHKNYKAQRLKHLLRTYGIDVAAIQEVCINWGALKRSQTLASLVRDGASNTRSVSSFNENEQKNVGRKQRGGTASIIFDDLAAFVKDTGTDHTKLGRYSYFKVEGEPGHVTYFMNAYAPCGNDSVGETTNYKQQSRYIEKKGLKMTPQKMFRDDVLALISMWRERGARVVLMMDANEHVIDGELLCKRLRSKEIGMREVVHERAGPGPNTWFRGTEPIDGIWATDDIEVTAAAYLPYDPELGDHRPVVADFTMRSILGTEFHRILPQKARRLNSRVKPIRQKYIDRLEEQFKRHKIYDRLLEIQKDASYPGSSEVCEALEAIDKLIIDLMRNAEKGCRKLRVGQYEFSPQVKAHVDKCWALRQLIKYKLRPGQTDISHLRRFAWRTCKIENPMQYTLPQLVQMYKEAKENTRRVLADSPSWRQTYLSERLRDAMEKDHQEEARRFKEQIRAEAQRKTWNNIQYATKPARPKPPTHIDIPTVDGLVEACETKERWSKALQTPSPHGLASQSPPRYATGHFSPY
jgi:hypothetical protein